MEDVRLLADELDQLMAAENRRFLSEVPGAAHLTDDTPLDPAYYVRHRIETIKRIRMTARHDAVALAAMVVEDYEAARLWGRYICEELDHDTMFYADLERQGVGRDSVDSTPLLPATVALDRFLGEAIARNGSIGAVAYSVFVEWNSARFSRPAVEKAAAAFGDDCVAGSLSHLSVDETEDHYETMVLIAARLSRRLGTTAVLKELIRDVSALFRRYFAELHAQTDSPVTLVA